MASSYSVCFLGKDYNTVEILGGSKFKLIIISLYTTVIKRIQHKTFVFYGFIRIISSHIRHFSSVHRFHLLWLSKRQEDVKPVINCFRVVVCLNSSLEKFSWLVHR